MKEHILKTITTEPVEITDVNDRAFELTASRCRASNDFRKISVALGGKVISFDSNEFGDEYEDVAGQFAKALLAVVNDSCLLPKEQTMHVQV